MAKLPELPSFNDEFVADALAQIVRAEVTKTGLTKAVLGYRVASILRCRSRLQFARSAKKTLPP
jgi:hypothetical protein